MSVFVSQAQARAQKNSRMFDGYRLFFFRMPVNFALGHQSPKNLKIPLFAGAFSC